MQRFLILFLFCIFGKSVFGQPPAGDRIIKILSGENMRMMQKDSITNLISLAVNAMVQDGGTLISGDSIVVNERTQEAEIFGNVHINDGDTIHTRASYLKYVGGSRIAYLKRDVRISDGSGTINANNVEYDLATGIATYKDGGRIVRGTTLLTSEEAQYFSNSNDVFFKRNVRLTDPKYNIVADSLRYNVKTGIADFIAPTRITGKNGEVINTNRGTYNLTTGEAIFLNRTTMANKDFSATGDMVSFSEKSDLLQIEGNGIVVDSINNVTILGNSIIAERGKGTFLATKKPVMIIYKDSDSTYIAADTLYSGLNINKPAKTVIDSIDLSKNETDSIRFFLGYHHVRIFNDSLQAVSDSLHYSTFDSTFKLFGNPVVWNANSQITGDTMYLFTANQKPSRLNVFYNAMVVNMDKPGIYNQVAGRTLVANFVDGNIDNIRIKGTPAESIYYPLDEDSAYIGMNRTSSDVIEIIFTNKQLYRIKALNKVEGVLYPMNQIPADTSRLKNFMWLDERRPKNRLELFE